MIVKKTVTFTKDLTITVRSLFQYFYELTVCQNVTINLIFTHNRVQSLESIPSRVTVLPAPCDKGNKCDKIIYGHFHDEIILHCQVQPISSLVELYLALLNESVQPPYFYIKGR